MREEIEELRRGFLEEKAALFEAHACAGPAAALMLRYSSLVDGVVGRIFEISCSRADSQTRRGERSGLAIVATGGYGRRELNPYSDIDIAFVPSEEDDPWLEAAVHTAFRLVMDVFLSIREIRVGYAYRPITDAPAWDLSTRTALLDARHVCGDPPLTAALARELRRRLSPLDLIAELRQTAPPADLALRCDWYAVEPDLKEGLGSLRDLHRGRWLYRLLLPASGEEDLWVSLRGGGHVEPDEEAAVRQAAEWFWSARNWLHLSAGKRCDTVLADYQDRIARDHGFGSAQAWLAEHFRHAERLAAFRESAVRRVLQGPVELRGVRIETGQLLRADPGRGIVAALQLLAVSQQCDLPIAPNEESDLQRSGFASRPPHAAGREDCWLFLESLRAAHRVTPTLRRMARFGLLDAFVGGFSDLMKLAPPDPTHRWTVGEHSLRIVEELERLREGRTDASGARFAELARDCAHYDMLFLAALLHDAGKGEDGTDHCESGLRIATRVADLLELPAEKRDLLQKLVLHHLLLMRTARLQDLRSQAVVQQVAEKLGTPDVVRHLYVFSYADTRAVSERSWTSLDHLDLEELYSRLLASLAPAGADNDRERMGQIRRRLSAAASQGEEAVRRHCDALPASYILNTPLEKIAMHIGLLERLEAEDVVVDIYNRPGEGFSEVTVCAYDDPRPGLLAKITGVLYACDSEILRAQVFTLEKRERPVVLDTLWVRSSGHALSERRAARVRSGLRSVLLGDRSVAQLVEEGRKTMPEGLVVDSLDLRNDLSEEHTVIHIIARDLRGLLFLMTKAISSAGLHIHSAKVATWSARAENNFYTTDAQGAQLAGGELPAWRTLLLECLGIGGKPQ